LIAITENSLYFNPYKNIKKSYRVDKVKFTNYQKSMSKIHQTNFIKSYGDNLSNGIYSIHSRFNNVINFISEYSLVSIVKEEIGAGPLNIVISEFDRKHIYSLTIEDKSFILNGIKYNIDALKQFASTIKCEHIIINKLLSNLKVFENCLQINSPSKSLAFLIEEKRKNNFKTTFEKNFAQRIESAVSKIFLSHFMDGVKEIKGTGFGFTPSGDDFICGLLHGMNIVSQIFHTDLKKLMNEIYYAAKGNNPISNGFLRCAKQGLMFEKFKNLVFSILYLDEKQVFENTKKMCAVGATSGADMGVGFLKAFEYFSKQGIAI